MFLMCAVGQVCGIAKPQYPMKCETNSFSQEMDLSPSWAVGIAESKEERHGSFPYRVFEYRNSKLEYRAEEMWDVLTF